jgi:hypothetical protein
MAYQPQVPIDTLSSAARGYKQNAKFAELDGLDKHSAKVLRRGRRTKAREPQGTAEGPFGSLFLTAWCRL